MFTQIVMQCWCLQSGEVGFYLFLYDFYLLLLSISEKILFLSGHEIPSLKFKAFIVDVYCGIETAGESSVSFFGRIRTQYFLCIFKVLFFSIYFLSFYSHLALPYTYKGWSRKISVLWFSTMKTIGFCESSLPLYWHVFYWHVLTCIFPLRKQSRVSIDGGAFSLFTLLFFIFPLPNIFIKHFYVALCTHRVNMLSKKKLSPYT